MKRFSLAQPTSPNRGFYEIAHDNTKINLQRTPTPEVIYPYLFHDEYPFVFENGFSVTQIQFYPPWQFL
jgi:hypothetical protein